MTAAPAIVFRSLDAIRHERRHGCLQRWEDLADLDPGSTFFQRPLWAMGWYEAYADEWEPLVVVAAAEGALIGLGALGRHRRSGRVAFAGDHMADYRDFLVLPSQRKAAIQVLVRAVLGLSGGQFVIGPIDATSATVSVVRAVSQETGEWRGIARADPCWRVELTPSVTKNLEAKKSIRQTRAFYRRSGDLRYRRITAVDEWAAFRETFFRQNTLRQLIVDRPPSFHDIRKQKFFDSMFAADPAAVHVSALWLGDRCLASHFGYCARDTVYLGAVGMDVTEGRHSHSPGLLWLADLIANAAEEGYQEVDLTLGNEEYKARVGTVCVEVSQIHVYASRSKYWWARAHQIARGRSKAVARRLLPDDAYAVVRRLVAPNERPGTGVTKHGSEILFSVSPAAFGGQPAVLGNWSRPTYRQNVVEDLARVDDPSIMRSAVRMAVDRTRHNSDLHTLLVDDRLVSYGWSSSSDGVVRLESLGAASSEQAAAAISQLVDVVACNSFARGASQMTVCASGDDVALHGQLLAMGFSRITDAPV